MNGIPDIAAVGDLIEKVASEADSDLIFYAGTIDEDGAKKLFDSVHSQKARPNVMLMLTTLGGSPDEAYRIARFLQRSYEKFTLFIQSWCKSAGTLVAVGADEIVMSDEAQLGPLDIQILKPDEMGEMMSGLAVMQALETLEETASDCLRRAFMRIRFGTRLQVTTKTALDIAQRLATGLFAPVMEQIDPLGIGEHNRAMKIGEEYGKRLSGSRRNLKADAIKRLTKDYPSHGFVIDCEEAPEIFNKVRPPSKKESLVARLLQPFADQAMMAEEEAKVEFLSTTASTTASAAPMPPVPAKPRAASTEPSVTSPPSSSEHLDSKPETNTNKVGDTNGQSSTGSGKASGQVSGTGASEPTATEEATTTSVGGNGATGTDSTSTA